MAALSKPSSAAVSSSPISISLPAETEPIVRPTCSDPLPGGSAHSDHHKDTPACKSVSQTLLLKWAQAMAEVDRCEPPPDKRRRVSMEEILDIDSPRPMTVAPTPPESTSSIHVRSRGLYHYKGLYTEDFPDPLASSPISNKHVSPVDLATYMRACGPMADPDHFE
ncbi:hypothetical protein FRC11_010792, partial [Ceratobasidium sp. 423]